MPDRASRLVAQLKALLPGPQRQLDVLPAKRGERFVKAAEGEKFFAVEERRPAGGKQREPGTESCGWRRDEIAPVDAEKAAAELAQLARAREDVRIVVVDLAGHGEYPRRDKVRGQRRQGSRLERDVVIHHVDQRVARSPDSPVRGWRKPNRSRALAAAFKTRVRKLRGKPGAGVVLAGVVCDDNLRGLPAGGFERDGGGNNGRQEPL